ncbi:hypothetical protein WOLCODRAFT_158093 [Wolfiporia cocos MD-104 SS10]|uniref:Uncharacterized protein n=1 Tax=Wolfiporia cocos (strain MD-104) TaxID=742152 RepID=A0A2H3JMY3_WOLCO|nr:hypothetical protein WOLCODRAFT_158093 [Wolfiporia cocos MD-104 SS10]
MSAKQDLSSYSYAASSSLVLTADRSALLRRDKEPNGTPTSLAGRIDPREMGSRDLEEKKKKATDKQDTSGRQPKRRVEATGFGSLDIIDATQDVEGLTHHPRTAGTHEVHDVIHSAADTILETLKNENMKDFDKKEIEEVKITDYGAEDEMQVDAHLERKDAEIDEEMDVAVVFDEEEEGFEIRDELDEENEEAEKTGEAPSSHSKEMRNSLLGRQVSDVYPDPVTATEKATAVLSILGSEPNLRDCKNQLMELFEYQSFHIITKFLKTRDVIVWCTKLIRTDADERTNVKVEKGLAKAWTDVMDVDEKPKVGIPKTATVLCAPTGAGKTNISTLTAAHDTTDDTGQMHSVIFRQAIDAALQTRPNLCIIMLHWCPGHSNITGNTRTDNLARSVVTLPTSIPLTLPWLRERARIGT